MQYNKIMQLYDPDAEVKPKVFGMTVSRGTEGRCLSLCRDPG